MQSQPQQGEEEGVDVTKLDVDSMMDATSYGGVNLKVFILFLYFILNLMDDFRKKNFP